jgi:hypothetical protein
VGKGARLTVALVLFALAAAGVGFGIKSLLAAPQTIAFAATTSATTIFQVPPSTKVNMTIYQFDSGSPLRNQQIGQVTGTIGNVAHLDCSNPKQGGAPCGSTFKVINANAGNGVGHTFSIPTLGISVPLYGNDGNANLCAVAPCLPASGAYPHNTISFSFISPKGSGSYAWQCFVPCALGWLFGNAGPMQTVGYMGGFLKVA